ncbi:MAG TPA: hypothetical protein VGJ64_04995, partial [Gemmatimonadaceae bacterium]
NANFHRPVSGDLTLRVYVDAKPVDVPKSATVLDAIEIADAELASSVRAGTSRVMDSRGLPINADALLQGGTILRVVAVRP